MAGSPVLVERPRVTLSPTDPVDTIQVVVDDAQARGWQTDLACGHCDRRLCVVFRQAYQGRWPRILTAESTGLNPADYCRWCARPITARAEAACPLTGYIEFARLLARPH